MRRENLILAEKKKRQAVNELVQDHKTNIRKRWSCFCEWQVAQEI